ncbi:MAG: pyruvate dehydrogenase (acetyl-transferring), homodimeric type [Candidatus Thiodiazotropha taylori]|nr:pyruvate dehydrogenase (acetyl-transferring), homodimeric type [Candidatus Thiodiazotropha taylori]MCG8106647.1 pyruvate dehydrogenase (acetyl-transferring), homodimeric type [Candidatus Thiodiazotropha taylori]MCG8110855.1 pyruvate dehydrogenase (acetyl-transferring), homodimeric type [Candidatus Thiodiazotropha taylori]MCW4278985.1 pyruvate dehydrogenase (acetyl-transferring), homodimeric type [Candidatus Thiodiazotropha taylori]MCW4283204.1 pyruvate dehydrogenase (acetyl-transferring), ho
MPSRPDIDPIETQEWLDALEAVLENEGVERAHFLIERLVDKARRSGAHLPFSANTAYVNTIPVTKQQRFPGDRAMERRIRSFIRWNAMAMVVQANRISTELGGHISSFASSATLFDVGFNHFFHAPTKERDGDLIFFQGHSAPGVYARAYLEGRLSEEQLYSFRQEVDGHGLSSYPHPWLMPGFWQFPTVSMGLGPLMAIYQARFMRYLHDRGMVNTEERKVWAFCGDGEMDEPEALGAISLAGRERLDNLVFVINCNLQRLDGPVRGNGKIIQELEGVFRGAGWNVIKVIWGGYWDPLFARDKNGVLLKRMEECVDGDYQAYKAKGGAYTREHFFGKYPELDEMVANMTDEDIWRLNRGGHDPHKVFAAYAEATAHKGQPTVILAKTVKGYGMGVAGEGQNITHSQKKMGEAALKAFRDRFNIPISDDQIGAAPFYKPPADSAEMQYMHAQRSKLGGFLPQRRTKVEAMTVPPIEKFKALLEGSGDREQSTTMAFVRLLNMLVRDKQLGKQIVPIVPDEARTFGMEGMFRQLGIYSSVGQLYEPVDADQVMFYREDKKGQILQEGINEAGAMSSWIAAATSYSNHGVSMIPFYIYYSMFGFQRIGDLAWAAGDMQARGFLIGGTAGRTTLAGEGLQHQDGHSHLVAATIPNCVSYDPAFAYELTVIVLDGMRRMYQQQENVFYYITVMNENYLQPAMPEGVEEGIVKGMYRLKKGGKQKKRVQLLGSGTILREVIAAAELLEKDFNVTADIWSVTSFNELRREGLDVERWNTLHPEEGQRQSYVTRQLAGQQGPVVAATDYIRSYADQIRPFVPASYSVLGTDGYGRSDMRSQLRKFFEVNRYYVALAALKSLADQGDLKEEVVTQAIKKYKIDPDKPNPCTV